MFGDRHRFGVDVVALDTYVDWIEGGPGALDTASNGFGAVDDCVVADLGPFDLSITIEGCFDDALHERDGGAVGRAGEILEVVVFNQMVFSDDANSPGALVVISIEDVALHLAGIAVAERKRAVAGLEYIGTVEIAAALVRDDFDLAIAAGEPVVFDYAEAGLKGSGRVADADGFAAVLAERFAWAEVVVVDAVFCALGVALFEPDDKGSATVGFARYEVMIELVVFPVEGDPLGIDGFVWAVVVGDAGVCDAVALAFNGDYGFGGGPVFEVEAFNGVAFAADREGGGTGEDYSAWGFSADVDAFAIEAQRLIAIDSVGDGDGFASQGKGQQD